MKHKYIITLASLPVAFFAVLLLAPSAFALECSVLPDSVCNGDIMSILKLGIRILSGGVGVVSVGAFVWAGVLYASAGDSADGVTKAKDMMKNTAIGLVVFGVMYLALEWLIPGGVWG